MNPLETGFIQGKETTPSQSYVQGKQIGEALDWARLREEVLSLKAPDSKSINQIGSYPHGLRIAEIPEGADENDFLKGMRDVMEMIYTDGYFMVDYSYDDQAKIVGGTSPENLHRNKIYFNIEKFQMASGQPENI